MGEGSYCNFDLILERSGEEYRARVLDSPAGQASARLDAPLSPLELENFVLRIGRPRTGVRRLDSLEMDAVKRCGERLFQAAFAEDVRACFLRSRDMALEQGRGLRIRLRIEIPEFHDYPWEFLYNAHLNQFLALSKDTPVVRYLELPYAVQPLAIKPPLRILAMISNPQGFPPLNVEEEWRRLRTALAPLMERGLVSVDRLNRPTLSALQQQLRRGEYHIFHFIGHGGYSEQKQDGLLLLEEDGGQGRPVSGQYLGTVLHDHHMLRLVVLNACEAARTSPNDPYAGVAQTLVLQGIPAVIAMQFEIAEAAAITFAQEFYGAVADGFAVDAALSEARKAIFAAGNDVEWGTPVLYMRAPQGVIFDLPRVQPAAMVTGPAPYVDRELEQNLEQLYTEGLAAFWVEDWEKACDRFQQILNDSPGHTAASEKLVEARRQGNLSALYSRAVEAQDAENWAGALGALEELLKDSSDYRDARDRLEAVKRQKQLAELYAEARRLYAGKKWQAVASVFARLKAIDPTYPDPENLLGTAQRGLEDLKRQTELSELYRRAVQEMASHRWEEAEVLFKDLQSKEPGYLELERLLSKTQAEIQRSNQEQERPDQIGTLHELRHEALEAERQQETVAIARSTTGRSWSPLPKWLRIGLSGIFAVAAVTILVGNLVRNMGIELPASPRGIPTASSHADPTIYDDFGGAAFDGSYNQSLWSFQGNSSDYAIYQELGTLSIKVSDRSYAALDAKTPVFIREPAFFETRMALDSKTADGARLYLSVFLPDRFGVSCGIRDYENNKQDIKCWSSQAGRTLETDLGLNKIDSAKHVLRIEIDPQSMTFFYLVDGRNVGSFVAKDSMPDSLDEIRQSKWFFGVAVDSSGASKAPLGSVDYVRAGAIADDHTLYDGFDDPRYDGAFDPARWQYGPDPRSPKGEVSQQEGALVLSQGGTNQTTKLLVRRYQGVKITESIFIEGALKIDQGGRGGIAIYITFSGDDGVYVYCWLTSTAEGVQPYCRTSGPAAFLVGEWGSHGAWLVFRTEVDVEKNDFRIWFSGMSGDIVLQLDEARPLRNRDIWVSIWAKGPSDISDASRPLKAYLDYLRIGPLP